MATLDQIFICNPTDTDFEVYYDNERYTLSIGEETTRTKFLARHMAKHLSDRMMIKDFFKIRDAFMKKHKALTPYQVDQQLGTQKNMLVMQDNPERRIALYKILKDTVEVDATIDAYPQFKTKRLNDGKDDDGKAKYRVVFSTVGDIEIYHDFVKKSEIKIEPEEKKEEVKVESPESRKPGRPPKTAQA